MPYQTAVFSLLSVSCWSSSSLPPSRTTSSANRKLQSGHPPMDFFSIFYCITSEAVVLRWTLRCQSLLHCLFQEYINSTWDNGHLCHSDTVVRKKYPTLPFSKTVLDFNKLVDVVFFSDSPDTIMSDTIERFLGVDEITKELLLMFQSPFLPTALSWIYVQSYSSDVVDTWWFAVLQHLAFSASSLSIFASSGSVFYLVFLFRQNALRRFALLS